MSETIPDEPPSSTKINTDNSAIQDNIAHENLIDDVERPAIIFVAEARNSIQENPDETRIRHELISLLGKCRPCMSHVLEIRPPLTDNDSQSKGFIHALFSELAFNGALENHFKILMKEFGISKIDLEISKKWTCDELRISMPSFFPADKCQGCQGETKKKAVPSPTIKLHPFLETARDLQKKIPFFFDENKMWWSWINKRWIRLQRDEIDMFNILKNHLSIINFLNKNERGAMIDALKMCGSERVVKEVPKNWIYTLNGVFDIKTKQIFEATPEYFFIIGSSMDTPNIDKLFESWVGSEKISLYELCAYCLVDDYPIHRIFSCFGNGGNGKGQFEKILVKHVGPKNSTSASLRKLISSRFEAAKLYRKKVCIIDETPEAIESTNELKALSGDGMISVEFKNKQGFDINNTAKIVIMTNNVPEVKDKTDAWYRRAFLIKFPNHFGEGKSVVEGIPEAEYEDLLARCLQILPDLLNRGKFTNDLPTIQEKKKSYEQASRPIKEYLDEFCVKEDVEYPTWKMQEEYNTDFAPKKGCRTLSKQAFNDALETEGFELFKKEYTDSNGKRHLNKFVIGIRPIKDHGTSREPWLKDLNRVINIHA